MTVFKKSIYFQDIPKDPLKLPKHDIYLNPKIIYS